jgi:hypothetical protein
MRRIFILCFLIGLYTNLYSQIKFERGYFIDNNDDKFICFIKNKDWMNNPKKFEYKLDSLGMELIKTIKNVKEFGIGNDFRYLRVNVKIDISDDNISYLSNNKEPNWIEDTLFLKFLVEGKANLYYYEYKDLKRFFYNIDNMEIKQLVFKKYLVENMNIRENKFYLNQLNSDVNCLGSVISGKTGYNRNDLENYFLEYNTCKGEMIRNYDEKKKTAFRLRLTAGLNYNDLIIWNSTINSIKYNYKNQVSFAIGLEIESVLPFNKNKWGIIFEPTYNYYKSDNKNVYMPSTVDYKSIVVSSGFRYYIFLNEKSKIHLNPNYILYFPINSFVNRFEISYNDRYAFSIGYTFLDKYSVEIKYFPKKDILFNYIYYYSSFENLSILFRYTIKNARTLNTAYTCLPGIGQRMAGRANSMGFFK